MQNIGSTYFPEELCKYGLNDELLTKLFLHVKDQKRGHIPWQLKGLPELSFYSEMHKFLHKWPLTRSASKATIGRLYIAIDKNLQIKGQTPNNTYLFIDRMVKSHYQFDVSMMYKSENYALTAAKKQLENCAMNLQKMTKEFNELKQQLAMTEMKLNSVNKTLEDTTNKLRNAELKASSKIRELNAKYSCHK